MKKTNIFIGLIILSILYLSINVNSAFVIKKSPEFIDAYKNQNLVRLHVLANSNSPQDQYLKRKVRNNVIEFISSNPEVQLEKGKLTGETMNNVTKLIEDYLKKENIKYPVKVSYGNYMFPKRTYGDLTLPAGKYNALKIILGAGQGSNWWCVLLPPLCIDSETKKGDKSDIEIRFKLAEIFKPLESVFKPLKSEGTKIVNYMFDFNKSLIDKNKLNTTFEINTDKKFESGLIY